MPSSATESYAYEVRALVVWKCTQAEIVVNWVTVDPLSFVSVDPNQKSGGVTIQPINNSVLQPRWRPFCADNCPLEILATFNDNFRKLSEEMPNIVHYKMEKTISCQLVFTLRWTFCVLYSLFDVAWSNPLFCFQPLLFLWVWPKCTCIASARAKPRPGPVI